VEVSLNRLRWRAARLIVSWQSQDVNGPAILLMCAGGAGASGEESSPDRAHNHRDFLVPPIPLSDILSLRVGDPITHSLIIQYSSEYASPQKGKSEYASPQKGEYSPNGGRGKRTIEIQAGKEANFRLVFLILRVALEEVRKSGTREYH